MMERAGLVLVPVVGLGETFVLRLDGREASTHRFKFALDLLAGLRRRIPLGPSEPPAPGRCWGNCRVHVRDEGFVEGLPCRLSAPLRR